jgi:hypothetical protein
MPKKLELLDIHRSSALCLLILHHGTQGNVQDMGALGLYGHRVFEQRFDGFSEEVKLVGVLKLEVELVAVL